MLRVFMSGDSSNSEGDGGKDNVEDADFIAGQRNTPPVQPE